MNTSLRLSWLQVQLFDEIFPKDNLEELKMEILCFVRFFPEIKDQNYPHLNKSLRVF